MFRTPAVATLILVGPLLAGCIGAHETDAPETTRTTIPKIDVVPTFDAGVLHVDVPVPVVLVGFPAESVAIMATLLEPMEVHHWVNDLPASIPPDPDHNLATLQAAPMPAAPVAQFQVVAAGPTVETGLADILASLVVEEGTPTILNGTALESFLADALPRAGLPLDPHAPSIVVVHMEAFGVEDQRWRYDFPHGYLGAVRTFGERTPMLVIDPSAYDAPCDFPPPYCDAIKPVRETISDPDQPYDRRMGATGEDLEDIALMVRHATHFRILQGSVYPVPLAPCHALTLVLGVRIDSMSEAGVVFPTKAADLFHPNEIRSAFVNLTGTDQVYVDTKVLSLPVDDPPLDALARGEFATFEAQRFWLMQNWDQYWVPHDGCEPYVSFLVWGGVASAQTGIIGIGLYDSTRTYRVSLSWIDDAVRLLFDPDVSPLPFGGEGKDGFLWLDHLFTHEAGHTFAQRHPHDLTLSGDEADAPGTSQAFVNAWSSMSYTTDGRTVDFGVMDQANWARNRVGFLLRAASEGGLEGSPQWQDAMERLAALDWLGAGDGLALAVAGMADDGMYATSMPGPAGIVALPAVSDEGFLFAVPHRHG